MKTLIQSRWVRGSFLTALALTFGQGCSNEVGFGRHEFSQGLSNDTQQTPPEVVCDPFGDGSDPERTAKNGLDAKLTYLPLGAKAIKTGLSTKSFFPDAPEVVVSPKRLVLSRLNVSTRPFTEGFTDESTGETLMNLSGAKLIEYFSVQAESSLRLSSEDEEGDYELALLSDDGSTLDLDKGADGNFVRWVNNDGDHWSKFVCASQVVNMTRDRDVPIKLNYYQGPRVHIALMMLWRKKTASTLKENDCGFVPPKADYYFKSSAAASSEPTANFDGLLARGWKVLKASNYVLPGEKVNPCPMK